MGTVLVLPPRVLWKTLAAPGPVAITLIFLEVLGAGLLAGAELVRQLVEVLETAAQG
jgi:hypothetical protein